MHFDTFQPKEWMGGYQEHFRILNEAVCCHTGLKTRLRVPNTSDALDLIRFSVFMNDLTQLSYASTEVMAMSMLASEEGFDKFMKENEISFYADNVEDLPIQNGVLKAVPVFIIPDDDETKMLFETIEPLVQSGRLIPEPSRGLIAMTKDAPEGKPRHWEIINVDENSPFDRWSLNRTQVTNNSFPMMAGDAVSSREKNIFETYGPPRLQGVI
ncbi:hypothetical protein [Roseibium aggregatum]|uniref:Uncharacterized protein n=1 Tax=Roseibium aggregatum TaxID=187304 RepID=A0A926SAI5_9HYPH|nr:hypothetical protein [Roseibium aggregatum]MBD1549234.1 hypothetical protein [Roseibium aggregatum]